LISGVYSIIFIFYAFDFYAFTFIRYFKPADEAFNLAKDFHILCENEFPAKPIADYLTYKMCAQESAREVQQRKHMLIVTRYVCVKVIIV
jgi:hypothetical protein